MTGLSTTLGRAGHTHNSAHYNSIQGPSVDDPGRPVVPGLSRAGTTDDVRAGTTDDVRAGTTDDVRAGTTDDGAEPGRP